MWKHKKKDILRDINYFVKIPVSNELPNFVYTLPQKLVGI